MPYGTLIKTSNRANSILKKEWLSLFKKKIESIQLINILKARENKNTNV